MKPADFASRVINRIESQVKFDRVAEVTVIIDNADLVNFSEDYLNEMRGAKVLYIMETAKRVMHLKSYKATKEYLTKAVKLN